MFMASARPPFPALCLLCQADFRPVPGRTAPPVHARHAGSLCRLSRGITPAPASQPACPACWFCYTLTGCVSSSPGSETSVRFMPPLPHTHEGHGVGVSVADLGVSVPGGLGLGARAARRPNPGSEPACVAMPGNTAAQASSCPGPPRRSACVGSGGARCPRTGSHVRDTNTAVTSPRPPEQGQHLATAVVTHTPLCPPPLPA